ncbi:hypothetical protein ACFSX5_04570 [Devosia albogilva]|uniref:Uncharacterized protein n=1 Tax=Devosia albogilva TaxID=429726 RepID=A0ABW5QHG0_9HYPH
MVFQYSVTLPVSGPNKVRRFREWAEAHVPALSYSLPAETLLKSETVTIRLLSREDRQLLLEAIAASRI